MLTSYFEGFLAVMGSFLLYLLAEYLVHRFGIPLGRYLGRIGQRLISGGKRASPGQSTGQQSGPDNQRENIKDEQLFVTKKKMTADKKCQTYLKNLEPEVRQPRRQSGLDNRRADIKNEQLVAATKKKTADKKRHQRSPKPEVRLPSRPRAEEMSKERPVGLSHRDGHVPYRMIYNAIMDENNGGETDHYENDLIPLRRGYVALNLKRIPYKAAKQAGVVYYQPTGK